MMTTEEEGEALAGETWAGERMSLSAELPERSLPVQVPQPPPIYLFLENSRRRHIEIFL